MQSRKTARAPRLSFCRRRGLLLGFGLGWLGGFPADRGSLGSRRSFLSIQISRASLALGSHPMLLTHIASIGWNQETRNAKSAPPDEKCGRALNEIARSVRRCIRCRFLVAFPFPPFVITSRQLIGCSVALLALSGVFGLLNLQKTRGLRGEIIQHKSDREAAERLRVSREEELQGREAAVAEANAKFATTQGKLAGTEAELLKAQTEKNDLHAKLQENETEIAELRQRIETAESEPVASGPPGPGFASAADLLAQLEEAKKQLEAAEKEKIVLSDKMKVLAELSTPSAESARPRRAGAGRDPGIRGSVLAVNQAYNFVVLSLGGRQGVEPNSEMLVLRGGSFIGKIRISSVEPATAIGDIITSSLARGVQVQTGDIVIYGGSNH